jgi:3,4-dihydroxy-2-butanone 4-phosphate synthase
MIQTHVGEAVWALRTGRMVIIVDGPEREDEGDVCVGAQFATPAAITFMATHARGLICMPMLGERLEALGLPLMTPRDCGDGAAFTVSVDARHSVTTGICAADRARTVEALIDPATRPGDLVRPGHLFPLRYASGGLRARQGHTEASVDLVRLAGLYPAAVICEVMNEDGTMARAADLCRFSRRFGLPLISINEITQGLRCVEDGDE